MSACDRRRVRLRSRSAAPSRAAAGAGSRTGRPSSTWYRKTLPSTPARRPSALMIRRRPSARLSTHCVTSSISRRRVGGCRDVVSDQKAIAPSPSSIGQPRMKKRPAVSVPHLSLIASSESRSRSRRPGCAHHLPHASRSGRGCARSPAGRASRTSNPGYAASTASGSVGERHVGGRVVLRGHCRDRCVERAHLVGVLGVPHDVVPPVQPAESAVELAHARRPGVPDDAHPASTAVGRVSDKKSDRPARKPGRHASDRQHLRRCWRRATCESTQIAVKRRFRQRDKQCHLLYTHRERSIQRFTPHVERSPGEHPLPIFPQTQRPAAAAASPPARRAVEVGGRA